MYRETEPGKFGKPRWSAEEAAAHQKVFDEMAKGYWEMRIAEVSPESPPPTAVEPKRQHAPMPARAMRAMQGGGWEPVFFDPEGNAV